MSIVFCSNELKIKYFIYIIIKVIFRWYLGIHISIFWFNNSRIIFFFFAPNILSNAWDFTIIYNGNDNIHLWSERKRRVGVFFNSYSLWFFFYRYILLFPLAPLRRFGCSAINTRSIPTWHALTTAITLK